MSDYLQALAGDPDFAVYRIAVNAQQYFATFSAMQTYGAQNPTYVLGSIDCVHAAASALISGGVAAGTMSMQFVQSTSGISPTQMYHAIHLANGQPW
jgi:hypothetical protein